MLKDISQARQPGQQKPLVSYFACERNALLEICARLSMVALLRAKPSKSDQSESGMPFIAQFVE